MIQYAKIFLFLFAFILLSIFIIQSSPIAYSFLEVLPPLFILIFMVYFTAAFSRIFLYEKLLVSFIAFIFALIAIFLILWFFSGTLRISGLNDESYISYLAARTLFSGNLTYNTSFIPQLMNVSSIGLTLTTNNKV